MERNRKYNSIVMTNVKKREAGMEELLKKIEECEFILVGIGDEFRETEENRFQILDAFDRLNKLIHGKPYFIVSQNEDALIFQSKLLDFFVTAPFCNEQPKTIPLLESKTSEEIAEEQWNSYLNWLTATLNHNLLIIELGVGFSAPQVIRWPFEKTLQFNQKAFIFRINEKFPQLPQEIAERGRGIKQNAVMFLKEYDE